MTVTQTLSTTGGRSLLALIFILSGISKITGFDGTVGYMEMYGMPMASLLLVGAIVAELGGGLALLVGFKARLAALTLIVFTIPATLVFHAFWSLEGMQAQGEMIHFLKNLAIMGGLLLVVAHGPGAYALESRKA